MDSLKHLTLISDTGLMLFHTSFSAKEIDEVLISGFTGAITSIANQLGDSLKRIEMKDQTFYLHPFENFIILLATSPNLDEDYITLRLEILQNSQSLLTMGTEDDLEMLIDANNELHLEIAELFEIDNLNSAEGEFDFDIDEEFEFDFENDSLFEEVMRELDKLA
ncbi:MAG: hypothetical protein ACXAE3_15280 [Candidatus Kariarchaeaceae archaeon]|jgi:hypothetical protein